jgi:hypothetical protein
MIHLRWKRENRNNGNQEGCKEAREEGREEEKEVTFLQTEHQWGRASVP